MNAARLRRHRRGAGPVRAAMAAAGVAWHRIDVTGAAGLHHAPAAACEAVAAIIQAAPAPAGLR